MACSQNTTTENNSEPAKKDSVVVEQPKQKLSWRDSIIDEYINQTQQELVKAVAKDANSSLTIITDMQERNGVNYIVSQIGRTMDDKFTAEYWLYIDSIGGKTYTYDIPNDTLILWKK